MKREARDNRPYIKPVTKAELSEDNFWGRLILVLLLIAVAGVFITRGVLGLVNGDSGIREIACRDTETNLSGDLIFKYNIGEAGISASVEYKQLVALYTDACTQAYGFFVDEVSKINKNANKEVKVSPELYSVLKQFEGRAELFLQPIWEQYQNLFACSYDYEAKNFDPYKNSDISDFFEKVCYAIKGNDIKLLILGNNTVKLVISDEYMKLAEEYSIETFVGFGPVFEAVIVDYVSSILKESGYRNGVIASYDGFSANLNGQNTVYFKNQVSSRSCYVYEDGSVATRYISLDNGKYFVLSEDFEVSSELSCVEIYLNSYSNNI